MAQLGQNRASEAMLGDAEVRAAASSTLLLEEKSPFNAGPAAAAQALRRACEALSNGPVSVSTVIGSATARDSRGTSGSASSSGRGAAQTSRDGSTRAPSRLICGPGPHIAAGLRLLSTDSRTLLLQPPTPAERPRAAQSTTPTSRRAHGDAGGVGAFMTPSGALGNRSLPLTAGVLGRTNAGGALGALGALSAPNRNGPGVSPLRSQPQGGREQAPRTSTASPLRHQQRDNREQTPDSEPPRVPDCRLHCQRGDGEQTPRSLEEPLQRISGRFELLQRSMVAAAAATATAAATLPRSTSPRLERSGGQQRRDARRHGAGGVIRPRERRQWPLVEEAQAMQQPPQRASTLHLGEDCDGSGGRNSGSLGTPAPCVPRSVTWTGGVVTEEEPRFLAEFAPRTAKAGKVPLLDDFESHAREVRENQATLKAFSDRCYKIQANLDQRTREVQAFQQLTMKLQTELARSQREKQALLEQDAAASCVICLAAPATFVMVPCGHLALCGACCPCLPDKLCPVCRQSTEQKIRLFRP